MNNMKKPKIRFKGFTDDWEQRKLGDIAKFINGRAYAQNELLPSGKYKVLRVGNFYTNDSWYYSDLELDDKYYANDGDLLYTWSATFGPHIWRGDRVIYHYHIWKIDLTDELEKHFAVQLLEQDKNDILSGHNGSTMAHITKEGMEQKKVVIPKNIGEQRQLGLFFDNLDSLITLHQRKYEKLQIIKKSMLENCFPKNGERVPKIRFSGFTGDWEQRKLSNIADIVGGGTPSTSNPDYWDGDIDWYTPAEIGEQIFAYGSVRKITKEGLIHSSAKILPAHKTVLFTSRAGIGNMAILKRPAATNQGFQSLVCHDDIDPYFMFSMGGSIKAKAERVAAGSTFAEISGKKLGELEFMFPDTDEQKAIGAYFKNLDYLITLHQSELEKLQKIKKSLLERMFV